MTAEFPEAGNLPESLPHPGKPIILTLTVDIDGASSLRYTPSPQWAATVLRQLADGIESDVGVLD